MDEYEIGDNLGAGGFANVRKALHKPTKFEVAVKIYEKYKLIDAQVKQNLIREIKILYKLNHPGILGIYESVDTLSCVFLFTELIEGESLHDFLKN